jgi:RNA polymerase sigma-70 factor (ECF subfamily)
MEVSEEIAIEKQADVKYEKAHIRKLERNHATYSLDENNSVEAAVISFFATTPEEVLEKIEFYRALCQALNSLPETQGRRIEAHYIDRISQKHIAEAEGVSQATVNFSIKQGREAMRKFLKDLGYENSF